MERWFLGAGVCSSQASPGHPSEPRPGAPFPPPHTPFTLTHLLCFIAAPASGSSRSHLMTTVQGPEFLAQDAWMLGLPFRVGSCRPLPQLTNRPCCGATHSRLAQPCSCFCCSAMESVRSAVAEVKRMPVRNLLLQAVNLGVRGHGTIQCRKTWLTRCLASTGVAPSMLSQARSSHRRSSYGGSSSSPRAASRLYELGSFLPCWLPEREPSQPHTGQG